MILTINFRKAPIVVVDEPIIPVVENTEPVNLCFYRADLIKESGLYDKAWLKLNVTGDKVQGEFQHLPAESDSKVGDFTGTAGTIDQTTMKRTANVWWNSRAEGMEVKEELILKWGDKGATVGFGEMVDRGDGTYIYKDSSNLYYIKDMNPMDCNNMNEKIFTEKYIRNNIATIATDKPVLGGTWYVTTVVIDPPKHSAEVSYEDGHIVSKANITYTYQKDPEKITITKFEVKK